MLDKIIDLGISRVEAEELISISENIEKDYKKLKKGYPIQYLIGYVNFYGYKIKINKNVLIPRPETEFLVEKVIKLIKNNNLENIKVLDLCTGSGCIAIALSKELKINVTASDISKKALDVAKENITLNEAKVKLIKSNLFKNIKGKYNIIITNPPYVSKSEKLSKIVKSEPKKALYSADNGTKIIKKIIDSSVNYLEEKSILAIEIGETQGKTLKKYAEEIHKNSKIKLEKDLTGRDRYLIILKNIE